MMNPKLKPVLSVAAVAVVGFIGLGLWLAAHPSLPPLQGQVEARTIDVSAKIPGRIGKILIQEGDRVKAGTPLAQIAIPELNAKLAQVQAQHSAAQAKSRLVDEGVRREQLSAAQSQYLRAQAGYTLAQKSYDRVAALFDEGLLASQKHDEAKANRDSAAALMHIAQSQYAMALAGARQDEKEAARALARQAASGVAEVSSLVSESELVAPRDGEVSRIVLHAGEVAPAGFPIVTLIDQSEQWVTFNIREDELPGIVIGTTLQAKIPALAQDRVPLTVYWISPRADYAVWRSTNQSSGMDLRTFEVRARCAAELKNLRPGMSVLVSRH